jgi:uncharacterized protein with NRDE domain
MDCHKRLILPNLTDKSSQQKDVSMCLILIAHQPTEQMPLLVLANRDEYYARPTAAAERWDECSELIAGRDLVSGGSWFGARGVRWASVTNIREGIKSDHHSSRSRGWLVRDYLLGNNSPQDFLAGITEPASEYAGFNLLLSDGAELWYKANRGVPERRLEPGIYGLSNHFLDTPWPKVVRGKRSMHELLAGPPLDLTQPHPDLDRAFAILADTTRAADSELPDTGIPLEWERALSASFITKDDYGTRCSTLLSRSASGKHLFVERRFTGKPDFWDQCEFTW